MPEEHITTEEIVIPDTVPADITELAPLFKVLLHNDDLTPGEFVSDVIHRVFEVGIRKSIEIAWEAHTNGIGLVKVVGEQEAETGVNTAHALARAQGFPLTFTVEEA